MPKRFTEKATLVETHHGDLHFGNILFDAHTDKITFIDPRGSYDGQQFGDTIYDIAKLSHDLYHGYNAIVANTKPNQVVKDIFVSRLEENLSSDLVKLVNDAGVLLLATCMPLHSDDPSRQARMAKQVKEYLKENKEKENGK